MWVGFFEELEFILCKDSKSYIDLIWRHLRGSFSWISFSYFSSIPNTSRRLRRGNIRKKIISIKIKFPIQVSNFFPKHHSREFGDFSYMEDL
jgi:hypothetical protein